MNRVLSSESNSLNEIGWTLFGQKNMMSIILTFQSGINLTQMVNLVSFQQLHHQIRKFNVIKCNFIEKEKLLMFDQKYYLKVNMVLINKDDILYFNSVFSISYFCVVLCGLAGEHSPGPLNRHQHPSFWLVGSQRLECCCLCLQGLYRNPYL